MKTPLKSTFKFYYLLPLKRNLFAELQVRAKIFPKRTIIECI